MLNALQAVLGGQSIIVRHLTSTHVDLRQRDASGRTILACAVQLQHVHLVAEILKLWEHSVPIDLLNRGGRTALHYSAECLAAVHKEIADAHMLEPGSAVHEVNDRKLAAAEVSFCKRSSFDNV